eukprot:Rmarinus@m.18850
MMRFIDIGANLTDRMYQGEYNGKKYHDPDLDLVMERAFKNGVERLIVTGGSLEDAGAALKLVSMHDHTYCTVGVHPTRCNEFEGSPDHVQKLLEVIEAGKGKVVAVGECGLDYDRLQFCGKDVQKKYFEEQTG